eukprot:1679580-Pyramimonas_sp.AAC.1
MSNGMAPRGPQRTLRYLGCDGSKSVLDEDRHITVRGRGRHSWGDPRDTRQRRPCRKQCQHHTAEAEAENGTQRRP